MLRLALTGNIASGKSVVAGVWRRLGASIVDADELARDAVAAGSPDLERVVARFGAGVLAPDGTLDRAALRARVFSDESERHALESILHPAIERLRRQADTELERSGAAIVVHVIPLLFETGLDRAFDRIILVDAPADVRVARIVAARGIDAAEAARIVASQMPASRKREHADLVIDNDGTLDALEAKAAGAWSTILGWAEVEP